MFRQTMDIEYEWMWENATIFWVIQLIRLVSICMWVSICIAIDSTWSARSLGESKAHGLQQDAACISLLLPVRVALSSMWRNAKWIIAVMFMLLININLSSSWLLWRTLSYLLCVVFGHFDIFFLNMFIFLLMFLSLAPCKAGVDRPNPFQGGRMTTCHAVDEALRHRLQLLCGDEIHHVNATNCPKFSAMLGQSFVIFQQSWNNTKQLTLITLTVTRHIFRNATVVAHHKQPQSCFTWPTMSTQGWLWCCFWFTLFCAHAPHAPFASILEGRPRLFWCIHSR